MSGTTQPYKTSYLHGGSVLRATASFNIRDEKGKAFAWEVVGGEINEGQSGMPEQIKLPPLP